ncbi:MAG TPA: hypothetical protein VN648_27420 [Candidatus Methylomirabilis sp.]|nr:hypothetical protein [Candidatus Methylomirabilis sp.]
MTFAASPAVRPYEADAATIFWNVEGAVRPGKGLGPEGGLRFLEWFFYDYTSKRGETLLGAFADVAVSLDSHDEYVLLASLVAPMRAYEVTRASGPSIMVKDLLTGSEKLVGPLGLPEPQVSSDILICRLLQFGRIARPGVSVLVLPAACREELLTYLRTAYQLARPPRHMTLEDFLDGSTHLYHHFFLSRGRNRGGRGMETTRAVAFAPGYVVYRGKELSRIRAALDRQSELERDEAGGDEVGYVRVDLERGVVRATVLVRAEEVELRADSREELAAAKEFLETCLRGLIHSVQEQMSEPAGAQLDEGRRARGGPPGASFLSRYVKRWPDTPHPILDDHTPRNAVRFSGERIQVVSLLTNLERDMARQKSLGRASADLADLWDQLQLTPDPPRSGRLRR